MFSSVIITCPGWPSWSSSQMLFVQGGSAHRIGLLYIIIQEQKAGIFHKKMFGKRTVWIINQMYIRAILRKGLFFISNRGLMSDMCQQRGPPKILNRNRWQLLQGKYQGALISCLMTPNLLLKSSACFQLSKKKSATLFVFFYSRISWWCLCQS